MDLPQWFANFLIKKSAATRANKPSGVNTLDGTIKSEIILKQKLAKESHKPIFQKLKTKSILMF